MMLRIMIGKIFDLLCDSKNVDMNTRNVTLAMYAVGTYKIIKVETITKTKIPKNMNNAGEVDRFDKEKEELYP
jgi:hypothetical protein